MSLLNLTVREYLAQAASDAPTPGGGSVAALAGALATSMAEMAGRFTAGRKKYAAVDGEIRAMLADFADVRARLMEAVDRDAEAFAAVGAAYARPRLTPEESTARTEAIARAAADAADVPLAVLRAVGELASRLPRLAEAGNPNLATDAGVAAALAAATATAARLNVFINLKAMPADGARARRLAETTETCARIARDAEAALAHIDRICFADLV